MADETISVPAALSPAAAMAKRNPYLIALTVTLATFMEVLDTSIANVAIPHIGGSLSADVDETTWVLTSYLVANAIILPLSAWISSILGRKNYYMLSVLIFTLSSLLCGLAPSLMWLVIFRIIQGLGGGGLQPSEQAILADTFSQKQLGMGMAVYGIAVVTAPILGPTLGGWITDNFNWRWIFFINVPVGMLSLFLTSRLVQDPPTFQRRTVKGLHIDYIGLASVSIGIGALQLMLDKGQRNDWFESHFIATLAIVAFIALSFLIFWEIRQKDPMIDLRLLGERNFAISCLLMFVLGVVLFGSTLLLPLYLQTLMGYTATTAGLVLSPGGLITMACMPLVGFLLSKVQARWLIMYGLLISTWALWRMGNFNLNVDYHTAVVARIVQASGLGFLFIPINTVSYAFVPKNKRSQASGLINLARNIGGSVGIATASTMLDRFSQHHQNVLISHAATDTPAYQTSISQIIQALHWNGMSLAQATASAPARFYGELLRQAKMLSYVDVFRLMSLLCLLAMVSVVFLKKPQRPPEAPVVH